MKQSPTCSPKRMCLSYGWRCAASSGATTVASGRYRISSERVGFPQRVCEAVKAACGDCHPVSLRRDTDRRLSASILGSSPGYSGTSSAP